MSARRSWLASIMVLYLAAVAGTAAAATYEDGLEAFENNDFDRAFEVWRPLADKGDAIAQYSLGKLFERGGGSIQQDFVQAARWYRVASRQGIAAAQNNLALMHAQGRGVDRNLDHAIDLWFKAARQNHAMAQYNLGLAFYRGEGLDKDTREAAAWFRMAADLGLSDAQYAMGQMNRLGLILPKHEGKALGWYKRAAAQGHREAKSKSQSLEASGIIAATAGPPELVPRSLGDQGTTQPSAPQPATPQPAQTQTATLAAGSGPAAQPPTGQIDQAAAETRGAAPAAARSNGVAQQSAMPARSAVPAQGGGETPVPRSKPAVPQLAMQPVTEERGSLTATTALASAGSATMPEIPAAPSSDKTTASIQAQPAQAQVTQTQAQTKTQTQTQTQTQVAAAPSQGGGIQVWLASEKDAEGAMKLWPGTQSKFPELLGKARASVRRVELAGGTVLFRLMAGPLKSSDSARDLCALMRLKDEDAFCKVLPN